MALVYPVLAQIALTIALVVAAGLARVRAVKAGAVGLADVALSDDAFPVRVRQIGNTMNNQFETPVLFYALCAVAVLVGATGWPVVALAWAYVASRLVHAAIQVTSNDVVRRLQSFTAGIVALAAMWVMIAITLIAG